MASNSGRKSGSSGRSARKRVVIGAQETVRVRYDNNKPQVEADRKRSSAARRPEVRSKSATASRAAARVASAKKTDRNRRQQRVKLKSALLVAGSVVALVLLGLGVRAVIGSSAFAVSEVEVEGHRVLTEDEVRELAAVPQDVSIFSVPRREISERIEVSPWVESAAVERRFPNTVKLVVTERTAGAVVDGGGAALWLVSTDGVWLGERSADATGLVMIRDVGASEIEPGLAVENDEVLNALKLIDELSPDFVSRVRVISAPTVDKTALIMNDDVEVFIGEAERVADKERIAAEILEREAGRVVYINVRVTERPTWRGL